jgi:hypothetical protein
LNKHSPWDEIEVDCPICNEPTISDIVSDVSQIRVCDNCGETYYIGAIFIAYPDKEILDLVRHTLMVSIEHPEFAKCFNEHLKERYTRDENGHLIRKES